jgi:hypothetical protein
MAFVTTAASKSVLAAFGLQGPVQGWECRELAPGNLRCVDFLILLYCTCIYFRMSATIDIVLGKIVCCGVYFVGYPVRSTQRARISAVRFMQRIIICMIWTILFSKFERRVELLRILHGVPLSVDLCLHPSHTQININIYIYISIYIYIHIQTLCILYIYTYTFGLSIFMYLNFICTYLPHALRYLRRTAHQSLVANACAALLWRPRRAVCALLRGARPAGHRCHHV